MLNFSKNYRFSINLFDSQREILRCGQFVIFIVFRYRYNGDLRYNEEKTYWGVNHCKQINNFYECLESGEEMFIPVESAYETMEMVCAIYKSGKTKERVYINK